MPRYEVIKPWGNYRIGYVLDTGALYGDWLAMRGRVRRLAEPETRQIETATMATAQTAVITPQPRRRGRPRKAG